mmetsp:Transcript_10240/g.33890  ORF Transcript_10240/g.33890 Transcript_10240/m.33890 type:complete len:399 (+) Transcript_10240:2935-4131(+)
MGQIAQSILEKSAAAETTSVRKGQAVDVPRILAHLAANGVSDLPAAADAKLRQFAHGQSNPTFCLRWGADRGVVVRKQPNGTLLKGAHDMHREHAFASALVPLGLPVPRAVGPVCTDHSIVGTDFWVYDYVAGRHFADPYLSKAKVEDRPGLFRAGLNAMARLHAAPVPNELRAAYGGEEKHGGGYLKRQVKTWTRQYGRASEQLGAAVGDEARRHMEKLAETVDAHAADVDETAAGATVAHGDFRPDNMIFAADGPRVLAVLDWELSTMGHPLSDLATFLMPHLMPPMLKGPISGFRGLRDLEKRHGVPPLKDLEAAYFGYLEAEGNAAVVETARRALPHFALFSAVTAFRNASIVQGVYARAKAGNASSANAEALGAFVAILMRASEDALAKHAHA